MIKLKEFAYETDNTDNEIEHIDNNTEKEFSYQEQNRGLVGFNKKEKSDLASTKEIIVQDTGCRNDMSKS